MDDRTWAFLEAIKCQATGISSVYVVFENEKVHLDLVREMKLMIRTLKKLSDRVRLVGTWGDSDKSEYLAIDKRMDEILDIGAEG